MALLQLRENKTPAETNGSEAMEERLGRLILKSEMCKKSWNGKNTFISRLDTDCSYSPH